jgi:CheY-like chemotaxis protein
VRAFPELDTSGAVRSMLTISSDHTFRERAMDQLRTSEALLQQADQRKNEFMATLAHELRSPLAPISTSVQLMKRSEQPELWRRSMQVIERQLGQLVELVDDLMDIARVGSGKLRLRVSQVSLQSAVSGAVESAMPLIDRDGQQLAIDLPGATVWLDADPVRLTQIFANLLTNASKYSPERAHIGIAARVDAGIAVVTVSDNGVGLTPDSMSTIFDLFAQVDARHELAQGGLGIGLSLVRQLVALHGGEVSVASDGPGQGSRFTVRLPVSAQPSTEREEAAAVQSTPRALKVLVVDDNVDGAASLVQLLQFLGHQAHSAHNGNDALHAAANGGFDLVLLDLGLPDMSGVQVALHIRGKAWGKKLRVVALTGLGQQQDRDLTTAAGFDLHLVKPIRIEQLLELAGDASQSPCGNQP